MDRPPSPEAPRSADQVFASWLARRETEPFAALLAAHPEHARELRDLHVQWERVESLMRLAGLDPSAPASFAERLKAAHGEGVDPEISLEGPGGAGSQATSEFLKRLGRKSTGSRYSLEGEIARGGMGAILRVWDEDIRRHLAMKVILGKGEAPATGGTPAVEPGQLARFLEEAQVTGQLDHPGIVPVHELGLDRDGRVFFTMKLVKGRNLLAIYDLVFEGKEGWNETRALSVLLRVCEAVAYARKKGVIHRDLKPANVMVGDFGEVYVMDWGLARVVGHADQHDVRIAPEASPIKSVRTARHEEREDTPDSPIVTMDGDVVGTPAYMSPEQARGEVDKLSARSDVYAIGAMLYHLLARQMPFVPPNARVSAHAVLMRLIVGPPTSIASIRADTPDELVAICDKAMAREAQRRYADTVEFAEDLRAYLERRVVKAYEAGAWAEAKKWVKRNKATTSALVVAIGLGIAAPLAWNNYSQVRLNHLRVEERRVLASVSPKALPTPPPEEDVAFAAPFVARLSRRLIENPTASEDAWILADGHIFANVEMDSVQAGHEASLSYRVTARLPGADPQLVVIVEPFLRTNPELPDDFNRRYLYVFSGDGTNLAPHIELEVPVARHGSYEFTWSLNVNCVRADDLSEEAKQSFGFGDPAVNRLLRRDDSGLGQELEALLLADKAGRAVHASSGSRTVAVIDQLPSSFPVAASVDALIDEFVGGASVHSELISTPAGTQALAITAHFPSVMLWVPLRLGLSVDGQEINADVQMSLNVGPASTPVTRFSLPASILIGRDRVMATQDEHRSSMDWQDQQTLASAPMDTRGLSMGFTLTWTIEPQTGFIDLGPALETLGSLALWIEPHPTLARKVRDALVFLEVTARADLVLDATVDVQRVRAH